MKKILLLFLIFIFISAGCNKNSTYYHKLIVGDQTLYVEIVDTNEKRMQGLSGREILLDSQGMLFDFRNTDIDNPPFWMKGMKFNIDIIWIKNFKMIGITKNVPVPVKVQGSEINNLPLYYPPSKVDMAMEVNAGWSDKHEIKVGDKINF